MEQLLDNFQDFLAAAEELLRTEGHSEAAGLLRNPNYRIEQTDYEHWNNGISIWTVFFPVRPVDYSKLGDRREILETQIASCLHAVLVSETDDGVIVKIVPKVEPQRKQTMLSENIQQSTRQNIIDGLRIENVDWSGQLEDVEFLHRIFDLEALPSTDSRFENAGGDIWQHRVNNPEDWYDDWIYEDERFRLLIGPTEEFLKFLCEIVHPVVRPERAEAQKLVQHFNDQLRREGWCFVEEEKIAGRSRYVARRIQSNEHRSVSRARTVADALDAGWMQKEIERIENAIDNDPALAIGTAKELVETCCKTILTKREVTFSRSDNLQQLTKLLAKELSLVPEGISEEARGAKSVRLILSNLSALTTYIAELRGLYGSGHGRDGNHRGLEPRHARLVAGAAVTFIDFVTETHHQRPNGK